MWSLLYLFIYYFKLHLWYNGVGLLISYAVEHMFDIRLGKAKYCKIGIFCLYAWNEPLMSYIKHWLARIKDKQSERRDISTSGMLFRWSSTMKFQLMPVGLVHNESSSAHQKWTCPLHDLHLTFNNNCWQFYQFDW